LASVVHVRIRGVLIANLKAQLLHLLRVPAADKVALVAVVFIDRVSYFDVVCETTDGLGIRPLEAVGVVSTLGAARAGVAVGGAVVGNGGFGEVVPPVAAVGLFQVRVRVGEER
jgi:hypothetical protein